MVYNWSCLQFNFYASLTQKLTFRRLVEVLGVDPCWGMKWVTLDVNPCWDMRWVTLGVNFCWGMRWVSLGVTGVGLSGSMEGAFWDWSVVFGYWRIWCGPMSGCMLKCGSLAGKEGLGSGCLSCLGMKCWFCCVWMMMYFPWVTLEGL